MYTLLWGAFSPVFACTIYMYHNLCSGISDKAKSRGHVHYTQMRNVHKCTLYRQNYGDKIFVISQTHIFQGNALIRRPCESAVVLSQQGQLHVTVT